MCNYGETIAQLCALLCVEIAAGPHVGFGVRGHACVLCAWQRHVLGAPHICVRVCAGVYVYLAHTIDSCGSEPLLQPMRPRTALTTMFTRAEGNGGEAITIR